jgi:pimeloyl-ACP methyl ester carboxylesterase
LLNDPEVLDQFRVIAFDLPWHGKSSPPPGWHNGDYRLTTGDYLEIVLAVIDTLELDQPIVMGCSIGGRLVLHLALSHPDRVGGVIGLEAGAHVEPYYDLDWLHRPDVHGGEVCAAIVSGLIGPYAPEAEKWETLWHYMQSGPGVFKGDLWFYKVDGDLRPRLGQIDTSRCPIWLLTGEYDYSNSPADTDALATAVAGATALTMEGLGHFPMSEDYPSFRDHLLPVLDAAAGTRRKPSTGSS